MGFCSPFFGRHGGGSSPLEAEGLGSQDIWVARLGIAVLTRRPPFAQADAELQAAPLEPDFAARAGSQI